MTLLFNTYLSWGLSLLLLIIKYLTSGMIHLHRIYNIENTFRLENLVECYNSKYLLIIPSIFDVIIPWCNKNHKSYNLDQPKQSKPSVKGKSVVTTHDFHA